MSEPVTFNPERSEHFYGVKFQFLKLLQFYSADTNIVMNIEANTAWFMSRLIYYSFGYPSMDPRWKDFLKTSEKAIEFYWRFFAHPNYGRCTYVGIVLV